MSRSSRARARRLGAVLLTAVTCTPAVLLAAATPASAHAQLQSSKPAAGATVAQPPTEVRLRFTEAPARSTVALVRDGCRNDVTQDLRIEGDELVVQVAPGQPGAWAVTAAVLSDEDGHSTESDITFTVSGQPDCTSASPTTGGTSSPAAGEGRTQGAGRSASGGSSTASLVLLGGGALLAVAGAFLVRRRTRGSSPAARADEPAAGGAKGGGPKPGGGKSRGASTGQPKTRGPKSRGPKTGGR
jgi:LPXTG-motif cell wall-anchored protein